jgi:hypothetical protein
VNVDRAAFTVVFPQGVNWFYERAAQNIRDELRSVGVHADACGAAELLRCPAAFARGTALIVSVQECVASLDDGDAAERFVERLRGFRRRILVNYDCIYTDWFRGHFAVAPDLVTDVADVNIVPQTRAASVLGVPYHWIPEGLTGQEQSRMRPWTSGRPVPWVIAAHASPSRAAFLEAVVGHLGPRGFAFFPAHRPYRDANGTLTETSLHRVLARADVYLWNSHHEYPFHECLRAPHAIQNGAVPAKIDPLFSRRFADVPWVFADLDALRAHLEAEGLREMYDRCREFLLRQGSLAAHLAKVLGHEVTAAAGAMAS